MKKLLILFAVFQFGLCMTLEANQDSLNRQILNRLDVIDNKQEDLFASMVKQQAFMDSLKVIESKTFLQRLQEDIKDPYQGFKTLMLFVFFTLSTFLLKKFGPTWWQNFVRWIVENEDARLKNHKKILVLSSTLEKEGSADNENFIKGFFKSTGFNEDNIHYEKINTYESIDFDYDLVFVNNEDGVLDQSYLETYVIKKPHTVLFYFSAVKRWNFQQTKISNRMNSATFKAQIYGNLLSSLKYQDSKLPNFSS